MSNFNIVRDYPWAIASGGKLSRESVPRIKLVQYQQMTSHFFQSLKYWATQVGRASTGQLGGIDVYKNLYSKEGPINKYLFPFYADYHHNITNSWGEAKGAVDNLIDGSLVPVAKIFRPSAGIESPRHWQGTNSASYSFSFDLLNTIVSTNSYKGGGGVGTIKANKEFMDTFINANLSLKESVISALPPSIYEVIIPGIRYSPVAVLSNLTIQNVGQNNYSHYFKENIPDAWRLTVQVQELIIESKQIYEYKSKVSGSIE